MRKMDFEVYKLISGYPEEFPRLKNACLKWAWTQPPMRGWCQLPPSISYRLSGKGSMSMLGVMRDIENAFDWLNKLASTVVEVNGPKKKTKWLSELGNGVVENCFAMRRLEAIGPVAGQVQTLQDDCTELMATKMLPLVSVEGGKFLPISAHPPPSNPLLIKR